MQQSLTTGDWLCLKPNSYDFWISLRNGLLFSSSTCFNTKQVLKICNITFVHDQLFDGIFPYFDDRCGLVWPCSSEWSTISTASLHKPTKLLENFKSSREKNTLDSESAKGFYQAPSHRSCGGSVSPKHK